MAVTVLVTGAAGQVGRDLVQVLAGSVPAAGVATALLGATPVLPGEFHIVELDHSKLDVTDAAACRKVVAAAAPEVVVHLAAFTAVDRAESDAARAQLVNEIGTRNVVAAAEESSAHLIALSTDYVFAGDLGRALDEDDRVGPLSVYGKTKLDAERTCPPGATIVRTSWVAGLTGRSVVPLAAAAAQSGAALRFVDDQVGTWTSAADLAAGLVQMIRLRPQGIVHVAGSGEASWYEVVRRAVELSGGSEAQVQAISTAQLDPAPAARRPPFSPLVSRRLGEFGGVPLPHWTDGLGRLVRAIGHEAR